MAILGWLLRLLAVLFVVRLVLRAISGARRVAPGRAPKKVVRAGGALARDPHCGTYVPQASAVTARSGGTTLYFCSTTCRDAHLASHARAG